MTWYTETRLQWIREALAVYGFVRREHIMKKFGVSTPQASEDLRVFRSRYPGEIFYNLSSKRYEAKTGAKPAACINNTEQHHGNNG